MSGKPTDYSDDLGKALVESDAATYALSLIAKGRKDNGRPLAAETSRQIARETLAALGMQWA